jgi:hypothetical protein
MRPTLLAATAVLLVPALRLALAGCRKSGRKAGGRYLPAPGRSVPTALARWRTKGSSMCHRSSQSNPGW